MIPIPDITDSYSSHHKRAAPERHPLAGYSLASLLQGATQLRPTGLALQDDGASGALTLAGLLQKVEVQAARLFATGLNPGDTAALIATPANATIVSLLAACRLGLNVVLLPPAMTREMRIETTGALGADAILSPASFDGLDLAEEALASAMANESVRVVGMTQGVVPDGAIALDGFVALDEASPLPSEPRGANMTRLITFEMTPQGRAMPMVQEQATLIAAAMAFVDVVKLGQGQRLVTSLPPATHAGLAAGLVAMLLSGMTLHYMPVFSLEALTRARQLLPPASLLLPERVVMAMSADADAAQGWQTLLAMSRWSAEGLSYTPPHALSFSAPLFDLHAFGERAMLSVKRDAQGRATALPDAPQDFALNGANVTALKIEETPAGAMILSGAAVSGQHLQSRPSV